MSPALPRVRISFSRRPKDSLAAFALGSLIVHAAAIGLIAAAVSWLPSRRTLPPDPGFFVRLADLPPAGGGTAAVPEAPKPAPTPSPPKPPEPKQAPKPSPRKEIVLPDKSAPRARPAKPEAAARAAEPPSAAPAGGGGGSPGTAGPGVPGGVPGGSGSSLEIADFQQAWYTALLLARLKAVWRPPFLPADAIRSVTVSFVIRRNGSVEQVQVEVPSNVEALNTSAVRAVYDAAPLPPLPAQERRDSVPARMVFEPQPEAP